MKSTKKLTIFFDYHNCAFDYGNLFRNFLKTKMECRQQRDDSLSKMDLDKFCECNRND